MPLPEDAVPAEGAAPVALADHQAVEAGLDALEQPADSVQTGTDRLRKIVRAVLPPVLAIVLLIGIWQALWAAAIWPEYKLPAPGAIGAELLNDLTSGNMAGQLWVSVHRAVFGFLIGVVIATPLGLLLAKVRTLRTAIGPLLGAAMVAALLIPGAAGGVKPTGQQPASRVSKPEVAQVFEVKGTNGFTVTMTLLNRHRLKIEAFGGGPGIRGVEYSLLAPQVHGSDDIKAELRAGKGAQDPPDPGRLPRRQDPLRRRPLRGPDLLPWRARLHRGPDPPRGRGGRQTAVADLLGAQAVSRTAPPRANRPCHSMQRSIGAASRRGLPRRQTRTSSAASPRTWHSR